MNCDQVFEVLTSGPFPAGKPDDALVERHLQTCHECRQLAEALRPAVQLFHESLADDTLPVYEGAALDSHQPLTHNVMTMIRRAAVRPATHSHARTRPPSIRVAVWSTAAALVIVVLAVAAIGQRFTDQLASPRSVGNPSADHQPDAEGHRYLAALNLPAVCFHDDQQGAEPAVFPRVAHRQCCTRCHNAAIADRPALTTVAFLESCKACHQL